MLNSGVIVILLYLLLLVGEGLEVVGGGIGDVSCGVMLTEEGDGY